MKKIGPKNSKPELVVRKLVHSLRYKFLLHGKDLPGSPDIVFPKYKKVLFIHGCFWHGHRHCKRSKLPSTHKTFWQNKIETNTKRDKQNYKKLKKLGWKYLVIWQCQIKKQKINYLKNKILEYLRKK